MEGFTTCMAFMEFPCSPVEEVEASVEVLTVSDGSFHWSIGNCFQGPLHTLSQPMYSRVLPLPCYTSAGLAELPHQQKLVFWSVLAQYGPANEKHAPERPTHAIPGEQEC